MKAPGRVFLDTSVLIAASDTNLPGHEKSRLLLEAAARESCACGAHSLAEVYAVLSRLPGDRRQRPGLALQVVEQIANRVTVVPLTAEEYAGTIRNAAQLGIAGGTIYDALLVACARKAHAEWIYTWNLRHFRLAAPDLAERIVEP